MNLNYQRTLYRSLRNKLLTKTGLTDPKKVDERIRASISKDKPTPEEWVKMAKENLAFLHSIESDTEWTGGAKGRCYYVYNRTVKFKDWVKEDFIKAFAEKEKSLWYGQEFSIAINGKTLLLRKAVDSG